MGKWELEGKVLRELRNETKLSIFKIAKKVNKTGNYISLIERGEYAPADKMLLDLAELYNVKPAVLFKLYGKPVLPNNEESKYYDLLCKIRGHIIKDDVLSVEQKEKFMQNLYLAVEKIDKN